MSSINFSIINMWSLCKMSRISMLCNYFVDKHESSLLQQNYSDFINELYFQYHFQENASANISSSSANRTSPPYSVWQTQCLLHWADWFSFFYLSRAASLLSKPDRWVQPVFPAFRLLFLRLKIPTLLNWSAKVFQLLLQSLGKWTYASQTNVSKWLSWNALLIQSTWATFRHFGFIGKRLITWIAINTLNFSKVLLSFCLQGVHPNHTSISPYTSEDINCNNFMIAFTCTIWTPFNCFSIMQCSLNCRSV